MMQQTSPPPVLPAIQWPPEAFQMTAAYQLGPPNAVYRGRAKVRVILAKLFFIVIIPLAWGITLISIGISPASMGMEAGPLQYVALLGGIILLGGSVTLIWWVIKDARLTAGWWVVVCPAGFVFRKSKDEAKAVRWDQVNTVRLGGEETYVNGIHTGSFFRVLADLKDGTSVKFDDRFLNIQDLAMMVVNEVKRVQLPQVISAYNAGSSVSFGSLTVSQLGIALSQKGLPWHQFAGIQINKGYVDIFKKNGLLKWMHVRTQEVPNLFVLLSLIDYARGSKQ